jgi:hypothetical protein
MSGAGAAEMAFVNGTDSDLIGIPGAPTYYEPFVDPVINDLTLERALSRLRKPDQVFPDQSVAGNIEGAFEVEGVLESSRLSDLHGILFNNAAGAGDILTDGRAPTSRWYVGLDYLSGSGTATAERVLKGTVPLTVAFSYTQGEPIRVTATFAYADEESNTSITPSDISEANGDTAQFHGAELTLDGTIQSKEQSFTLSITDISRFQRGSQSVPVDAVVAAPQASLDVTTVITEQDQRELLYGSAGATTTAETIDAVSGSVSFSAAGTQIEQYDLSGMKINDGSWQNIIAADPDAQESYSIHVNGVTTA